MRRAPQNLYDFRPVRAARFEVGADGLVAIVVPRFTNRLLVKFLVPRLRAPDYRVRLDAIGSFVWQQCDGSVTVAEIGARASVRFGGDAAAMAQRVGDFLAKMDRERFVALRARDAAAAAAP